MIILINVFYIHFDNVYFSNLSLLLVYITPLLLASSTSLFRINALLASKASANSKRAKSAFYITSERGRKK